MLHHNTENRKINMNVINSNISLQNSKFKNVSYYSNCSFKRQNAKQAKEEHTTDKNKQASNLWKYITIGSFILALITDIIVERRIRLDDKAKIETLKKEKELADKLTKDLEEQAKKLEEEINKQKEAIKKIKKEGQENNNPKTPRIDVESTKNSK